MLDGATRTEALRSLGLEHAVVQMVDPEAVVLETWHHVVRQAPPSDVLARISEQETLMLSDDQGTPRIHFGDQGARSVVGKGECQCHSLRPGEQLRGPVDREQSHRPSHDAVAWRFPDWSVLAEFPILSVEDVMKAAVGEDLLPAGITRFLVPERALRLNADLALLKSGRAQEDKQESLEALLGARARAGRVRRYEETIIILDD